ncbi:cytochrome P450 PksS [Archangium gephyra]|uniref:Cytochrome P450 PksS n=1 Tax=Archangium gephyra TaxID=48 RepID=A0AAC8TFG4_9BACT|nr:cytochrome P450 [Archangium gephyra]AKJ02536.1 putative cytochrome P450 hydroxylase [Archangium gephyra]REG28543.1 cytochrome P450 PksS [Archangium gephyra]
MTGSGTPETTPTQSLTESAARKARLNPLSPENLLNPVPFYKELRETSPVHWSEELQSWLITRYDDVTNGFRDPRLSSDRGALFEYQMKALGAKSPEAFVQRNRLMMINRDGVSHLNQRRQTSPGFSPQSLDVYLPAIRRIMRSLVEQVQDRGEMDLVQEVSYQMPLLVLVEFLGLPTEDRQKFKDWSKPLADFVNPMPGTDPVAAANAAITASGELSNYLDRLINERRQEPGTDMISRMIQGGKMSQEELVANTHVMITAGHTTTTDQLGNGLHDLLSHPDQLQLLRENPSLVKSAVEEMLRFNPASPFFTRIAAEDFQLHGQDIKKGQLVFLGMAAANRDPKYFPDADRFDITRDNLMHKPMTFGFGPHHCLGAGLARRQLEVAIETLLERFPRLRLDESRKANPRAEGLVFRGFHSLPVRW